MEPPDVGTYKEKRKSSVAEAMEDKEKEQRVVTYG